MMQIRTLVRTLAVAATALIASLPLTATPAQAEPVLPINWNVDVTTTMKSLGQTVVVPTGTFDGGFDLGTGKLSGDLELPRATKRLDIGRLPLAKVTFAMEQAAPIDGTIDLATMTAKTTASFNVRIVAIRPVLTPWINLVRGSCTTRTPVTAELGGPVNLAGKTTFEGQYELPRFRNCGLLATPTINAIVPGPGNSLSATFYP